MTRILTIILTPDDMVDLINRDSTLCSGHYLDPEKTKITIRDKEIVVEVTI